MLQKHLGRRLEPLSHVLEQAAHPVAMPASLEDARIGKKVTEFPVFVQKRLVLLYLVGLQCGIHRPEGQRDLVHLTSDGFWLPVLERFLQGILEKYHSEKRKIGSAGFESITTRAERSGLRLPSTQRSTSAGVEVPHLEAPAH